ncbi:lipoyl synthase [Candidatus Endomicrobiellum devescovinae]|jgi:lipoic acid synthetase|uniref:lipoyl synthase n=1 Tax=Candidatus Endomicrobiellum devescovinae TaxID=3242322 RepID=UPI002829D82F|nr:lipoyl synthase [Endomicrobium sp.]
MIQEKKKITIADITALKKDFRTKGLNTVCQSAKCPNIGECFKKKTATFLILGKNCTRKCAFCAVEKYSPELVDADEPSKIAKTIKEFELSYSVITSVTRDDLPDGGAGHFAKTVNEIKLVLPNAKVEVLVPDFLGKTELIDIVLVSKPDVFSHNLETVPCLYDNVRKGADYKRSMKVLKYAKDAGFKVKTGIMLGLGETERQLFDIIKDVKDTGIDILTIGQYLAPTKKHYSVVKQYKDEEFQKIRNFALSIGIKQVISGRYVRSSYSAGEYF